MPNYTTACIYHSHFTEESASTCVPLSYIVGEHVFVMANKLLKRKILFTTIRRRDSCEIHH